MNNAGTKIFILPLILFTLRIEAEVDPNEDLLYRIQEVETRIEWIREYNKESKYLPRLLYDLSYMYIEAGKFDESKRVLLELKGWERPSEVEEMMPGILYLLMVSFYHLDRFEDCITQADQWILLYDKIVDDDQKEEIAAEVYWYKGHSHLNLAENQESFQVATDQYREARQCFNLIITNYQYSQFYQDMADDIEEAIEKCDKGIS